MENLYKNLLGGFFTFKEGILNKPGIKYIPKGKISDVIKLITESFIRIICVFTYIPQKHVI